MMAFVAITYLSNEHVATSTTLAGADVPGDAKAFNGMESMELLQQPADDSVEEEEDEYADGAEADAENVLHGSLASEDSTEGDAMADEALAEANDALGTTSLAQVAATPREHKAAKLELMEGPNDSIPSFAPKEGSFIPTANGFVPKGKLVKARAKLGAGADAIRARGSAGAADHGDLRSKFEKLTNSVKCKKDAACESFCLKYTARPKWVDCKAIFCHTGGHCRSPHYWDHFHDKPYKKPRAMPKIPTGSAKPIPPPPPPVVPPQYHGPLKGTYVDGHYYPTVPKPPPVVPKPPPPPVLPHLPIKGCVNCCEACFDQPAWQTWGQRRANGWPGLPEKERGVCPVHYGCSNGCDCVLDAAYIKHMGKVAKVIPQPLVHADVPVPPTGSGIIPNYLSPRQLKAAGAGTVPPLSKPPSSCEDDVKAAEAQKGVTPQSGITCEYAKQYGWCELEPRMPGMKRLCSKTCGYC
jgi:hypothetical protein